MGSHAEREGEEARERRERERDPERGKTCLSLVANFSGFRGCQCFIAGPIPLHICTKVFSIRGRAAGGRCGCRPYWQTLLCVKWGKDWLSNWEPHCHLPLIHSLCSPGTRPLPAPTSPSLPPSPSSPSSVLFHYFIALFTPTLSNVIT